MKTVFNSTPTLVDLPRGAHAVVLDVDPHDPIGRRLLALGLLPGTPVRAIRRAPLGDPSVYELRGYRLCLRSAEARRVRIEPLESALPGPPARAGFSPAPQ